MMKNITIALLFINCYTLQAQIGIGTPSPDPSSELELKSTVGGFLPPRLTTAQRDAIISPATGLVVYNSSKNCLEWYDGAVWYNGCGNQESSGGTAVVSSYNCSAGSVGTLSQGILVSGVTQTITATVTRAGTYNISAIANGVTFANSGLFTTIGTQDIVLSATGTPLVQENSNFILNIMPNCNFSRTIQSSVINAICDGSAPTPVVPITSSTGRIWMDRNLGASRNAVEYDDYQAYGCLYQWGRGNDGHASVSWVSSTIGAAVNGITSKQSTTDTPGDNLFITGTSAPFNWRSPQNDALWQGVTGINNPCPSGYRLPTDIELTAEVNEYQITNLATAYSSPLKFVASGSRHYGSGSLIGSASSGNYWSSTVSFVTSASYRNITGGSTVGSSVVRSYGFAVRCIKN